MGKLTVIWISVFLAAAIAQSGLDLWNAAKNRDITKVKTELAQGADPDWLNTEDEQKRGVLHIAAESNHPAIVRLLLEAGADTDLRDKYDQTAIYVASQSGHRVDVITTLAAFGGNVDTPSGSQITPLMVATHNGHLYTVEVLLNTKANINLQGPNGWTALHYAALRNMPEIARLLLEKGANPSILDKDSKTPIDHTREKGLDQLTKIIEGFIGTTNVHDTVQQTTTSKASNTVPAVQLTTTSTTTIAVPTAQPTSSASTTFAHQPATQPTTSDYGIILMITGCPDEPGFFQITAPVKKCYRAFSDRTRNWHENKQLCLQNHWKMVQPADVLSLRSVAIQTIGYHNSWLWLAASANGNNFVWDSNGINIMNKNPLWFNGKPSNTSVGWCLGMGANWQDSLDQVYNAWPCGGNDVYAFCEVPM